MFSSKFPQPQTCCPLPHPNTALVPVHPYPGMPSLKNITTPHQPLLTTPVIPSLLKISYSSLISTPLSLGGKTPKPPVFSKSIASSRCCPDRWGMQMFPVGAQLSTTVCTGCTNTAGGGPGSLQPLFLLFFLHCLSTHITPKVGLCWWTLAEAPEGG